MLLIHYLSDLFPGCLPLRAYRNAFELLSDMGFYLEDLRSRAVSSNKFGKAASQENLLGELSTRLTDHSV